MEGTCAANVSLPSSTSLALGETCRAGWLRVSSSISAAPGAVRQARSRSCRRRFGRNEATGSTWDRRLSRRVGRGGDDPVRGDDKPFFFSVDLPLAKGILRHGRRPSLARSTMTTVKASPAVDEEAMDGAREFATRTFTVNLQVAGSKVQRGRVKLKPASRTVMLHWDDKLTLEFNGAPTPLRRRDQQGGRRHCLPRGRL